MKRSRQSHLSAGGTSRKYPGVMQCGTPGIPPTRKQRVLEGRRDKPPSAPDNAILEGLTGDCVTSAAGLSNITFRFLPEDPAAFTGNDLPPYAELKAWKLHTVIWRPVN
ncbi:MAG: hypothetical protein KDN19_04155 [Verrucomicrobiae bacterium]|nr:hypothetical protein [Verrucomicrobiae bacterium]